MANKVRGEVSIKLDGKDRKLLYNFNAFAEFEDATGQGLFEVFAEMGATAEASEAAGGAVINTNVRMFKMVRSLLWAGLIHDDPLLTVKSAGNLIDTAEGGSMMDRFVNVMAAVSDAFTAVMSDGTEEKKAARS